MKRGTKAETTTWWSVQIWPGRGQHGVWGLAERYGSGFPAVATFFASQQEGLGFKSWLRPFLRGVQKHTW